MALGLLGGVCTIGICINFSMQGFRHVDAASELRQAKLDWQSGQSGKSLLSFISALRMAVDSGARWSFAGNAIRQMRSLKRAGELDAALAQCRTAARIIGHYDDEGALSYDCTVIEETIPRQSTLRPTPTAIP